jgi:hypothetical protein
MQPIGGGEAREQHYGAEIQPEERHGVAESILGTRRRWKPHREGFVKCPYPAAEDGYGHGVPALSHVVYGHHNSGPTNRECVPVGIASRRHAQ